jgi:hypothetical protein
MHARRGQFRQRASYHAFDVRLSFITAIGQRSADVAFPKAQTSQGSEGLGLHLRNVRLWGLSVVAAIRMAEANTRGDGADDTKLPAMHSPMMRTAKRDQIVSLVPAPLGTRLDVMKVQKQRIATTRDYTPPAIAAQHGSARRR